VRGRDRTRKALLCNDEIVLFFRIHVGHSQTL
jgi:hypothetical protein